MKKRDLILSIISLCTDRDELGRTSLQKTAYFVSLELDVDLGYQAHYYGPYSREVEEAVNDLVFAGLVRETFNSLGVSVSGHEVRRYEYVVTEEGSSRLKAVMNTHSDEYSKIERFITRLIDTAGTLSPSTLSTAAKVHFLQAEEGHNLSDSEIEEMAKNRGWSVSALQVDRVRTILTGGLVDA